MIEAAGGVVWRSTAAQGVEVLLIHRPHRDDWSLPKGKRKRRESALDCAIREVREETGLRARIGIELPGTQYIDRKGRSKTVRYWSMHDASGLFRPNGEVDQVRWVRLDRVDELMTDARDSTVVAGLHRLFAAAAA
ncbi:MAG: hydrolase [Ilumatobacteraceae bacterium]|nr:hydrolase [Ilumatobacteraceae bacterium]